MICRKRIRFLVLLILAFGSSFAGWTQTQPQKTLSPLSLELDEKTLSLGCMPGHRPRSGTSISTDSTVEVFVRTAMPSDKLEHRINVSAGYISGTGTRFQWNLEGLGPGIYSATVTEYHNGKQNGEPFTASVTIQDAGCWVDCDCGTIDVYAWPGMAKENGKIAFTANVSGGAPPTYSWTVENGVITSGQGTREIEVKVKKINKAIVVKATVQLGNLDPACGCPTTDSATMRIAKPKR